MALDAVFLAAVAEELRPQLLGLRIDKVQQPARDQVVLVLRGRRLLLSAGANAPRIQLTELPRDNPAEPPMFCMLLRKHLTGAKIADLVQPSLERLIRLELDTIDDLGRPARRTLVLEAMGRRSNLILLDGEGRIVDCLRRVDASMSAQRQVLPGLYYEPPAAGDRLPVTEETEEGFRSKLRDADGERTLDGFLLDTYFGLSPLMAREIAFRTAGETDVRLFRLGGGGPDRAWAALRAFLNAVERKDFTPILLRREGHPLDCVCLPVVQYGPAVEAERFGTFSALLDTFYEIRERQERARQRGADLLRTATTARDRLRRKLAVQERDYAQTQERDALRICGELITANLYRMEKGASRLACENFYDDNAQISIPLDPLLTPQQNAAKYFKRYNKAKTAERYLREQMEIARRDLDYLESVLEELSRAETEQDLSDIRAELREAGFLRRQGKREPKRAMAKPWEFRTSGGFRVLVGRSNRQNDKLTLKDADRRDLWFHTQKIHGSHTILCTEGREPSQEDIVEAAKLAAYHSQARESGNVPVDYALVRDVKKPAGARPGMVVYVRYQTVNVTPDKALADRSRVR